MIASSAQKRKALWKVAWKLAFRQIQRASIWMNLLIILIMILTFLNLVVITGMLTGLMQGTFNDNRIQQTGDIIILPKTGEDSIINTYEIRETLTNHPDIARFTERYIQSVTVEANYQTRWDFDSLENSVSTQLTGIDSIKEDSVTGLSNYIVEGEYLNEFESGYVMVGSGLLAEYNAFDSVEDSLREVKPGTRIKITYTGNEETTALGAAETTEKETIDRSGTSVELTVKGIIHSKVDELSGRVFITESDWKRIIGQKVDKADEIAMILDTDVDSKILAQELRDYDLAKNSEIKTAQEALPEFLIDLQNTFGMLGNFSGGVAVVVSCITVFVLIYINAITKRKQIGILKGIGIKGKAIEYAYIMQSLFYAIIGSSIGFCIVFFMLVPYFDAYPIDFPFSDGILAATVSGTLIRASILIGVTAIAGYIPAWLIVRQNTLDSILGR